MFDEPFALGRSCIHSLDPRVRLTAAAFCAVCLAVLQRPETASLGLGFALLLLLLSRPPLGALMRRLTVVNIFILFIWLTVPLTMPGDPLAVLGPFGISRQGVRLALMATLKSNAIVMVFIALAASMPSPTIGYALERLRFPSKLVFLFLFTYRYMHVIFDEWQKLHTAVRVRGFTPKTDLHTYRTMGYILGMVFVRSYERSLRVYEAMTLRGFQGRFQSVARFRATPGDAVFAVAALGSMAWLLLSDVYAELYHG